MRWKIVIQAASIAVFFLFFFLAAYPLPEGIPVDLFLRADPLLGIVVGLSGRVLVQRMLLSLAIVGATIFFGRFFCAYVCPLGGVIDASDTIVFKKAARKDLSESGRLRAVKYYLLVLLLVASLFGLILSHFLDPISLMTRTATFLLYPAVLFGGNRFMDLIRPVAESLDLVGLSHAYWPQYVYYMGWITLLIFLAILLLGKYRPRFWCRNLCPLGALLGLLSRFPIFKRRVTDDCTDCGLCRQRCPMGAIGEDPHRTAFAECILCRTCSRHCPERAIRFSPGRPSPLPEAGNPAGSISRRGFLGASAAAAAFGLMAYLEPHKLVRADPLIRPPGALPEKEYLNRCIRCAQCMKACITNTLQPSLFQAGLEGLWTPRLKMRLAPCEQRCNICGMVCPTQAIRALDLEERIHAKIGTAVIRRERCLVWEQDKLCLVCDEICPYDAIEFMWVEGLKRPFVTESRCNGCGQCEFKCPIQGESAIIVTPTAEIRLAEGSYIKRAGQLGYEFKKARKEELSYEETRLYPSRLEQVEEREAPGNFRR